jgi:hypothetical protein
MINAEQARNITDGQTLIESDGLHVNFEQSILFAAAIGDYGIYLAVNATNLKMLRGYGYWVNAANEPEDDSRSERMFVDWSGRFQS